MESILRAPMTAADGVAPKTPPVRLWISVKSDNPRRNYCNLIAYNIDAVFDRKWILTTPRLPALQCTSVLTKSGNERLGYWWFN